MILHPPILFVLLPCCHWCTLWSAIFIPPSLLPPLPVVLSISFTSLFKELLVNLTLISSVTMLSFSHMQLDWQGPGLHALSFWLQPPPTFYIHSYTHIHTHNTISVSLGQVQCFFSSDSCDFSLLTKTPKETRQGGIIPHDSSFFFLQLSSSVHTYPTKTHIKTYTKKRPCGHAYTLSCTVHKGTQLYMKELDQCCIFRSILMLIIVSD